MNPALSVALSKNRGLSRETLALAFNCALAFGLIGLFIVSFLNREIGPTRSDFVSYYGAAQLVATGHGGQLYNFAALGHMENHLVRPAVVRNGVLPYVYPPFFALFLVPISAFSLSTAYLIWLILNAAILASCAIALARAARLRGMRAAMFVSGVAGFLPALVCLAQGQTSILLLGLIVAAFEAHRSNHRVWSGILLAGLVVKPPLLLPYLLWLVGRRSWTALAGLCAGLAGLFAASIPTTGVDGWRQYILTLKLASGWHDKFGYNADLNQSLSGFIVRIVPAPASTAIVVTASAALVAVLVLLAHRSSVEAGWGLAMAVGLILSPHVLLHDLLLLLVPAALALRLASPSDRLLLVVLGLGYAAVLAALAASSATAIQVGVFPAVAISAWLIFHEFLDGQGRRSGAHMSTIEGVL